MMTIAPPPPASVLVALARLAPVLALELGCVLLAVGLGRDPAYRIAWSQPGPWLAASPATATAIALLRPVVLVLAGYLLVATSSYAAALLARAPRAVAGLARLTPAGVRRLVRRAIVVGVLTATSSAPAVASAVGDGRPLPPAMQLPTAPTELAPDATATTSGGSVTVVAGDHLWSIAARGLAAARGTTPDTLTPRDVAPYWVATVEANRASLRSGDPDLIHPGEEVRLPVPTRREDR